MNILIARRKARSLKIREGTLGSSSSKSIKISGKGIEIMNKIMNPIAAFLVLFVSYLLNLRDIQYAANIATIGLLIVLTIEIMGDAMSHMWVILINTWRSNKLKKQSKSEQV